MNTCSALASAGVVLGLPAVDVHATPSVVTDLRFFSFADGRKRRLMGA